MAHDDTTVYRSTSADELLIETDGNCLLLFPEQLLVREGDCFLTTSTSPINAGTRYSAKAVERYLVAVQVTTLPSVSAPEQQEAAA